MMLDASVVIDDVTDGVVEVRGQIEDMVQKHVLVSERETREVVTAMVPNVEILEEDVAMVTPVAMVTTSSDDDEVVMVTPNDDDVMKIKRMEPVRGSGQANALTQNIGLPLFSFCLRKNCGQSRSDRVDLGPGIPGSDCFISIRDMTTFSAKLDKYGRTDQNYLLPDTTLKMTRLDEKHALQRINDRFSNYTTHVNTLTDTNQKLESMLLNSKLTEEELTTIKEMYEAELKESRHLLEQNSSELAKKNDLQSKTGAMVRDLTSRAIYETIKLLSRLEDEQSLRKKADENLLSTEQALSHKEKLLLAAFREHDEDRRTIAQAMREKDELRSSFEASKKAHERETVLRVEAENALNATRQELAFVKDVHAAEVQSLKEKIGDLEVINTNLERDLRQEYEHRLQSELSDARARLDKLAHAQKNEFEGKMRQKLKQAQNQQEQDAVRIGTLNDSNSQLRIQNDALKAQVNNLVGKNNALEDALRNTDPLTGTREITQRSHPHPDAYRTEGTQG
eukprot:sb/3463967/